MNTLSFKSSQNITCGIVKYIYPNRVLKNL